MTYFTMTGPELKEAVARGEPMAQEEIDRRAAKRAAKQTAIVGDPYSQLRQAIDLALGVDSSDIEMETILDTLRDLIAGETIEPIS